jgi:hypothetical protein
MPDLDFLKLNQQLEAQKNQYYCSTVVNLIPRTFVEEKPQLLPSVYFIPPADEKTGVAGIAHVSEAIYYIPNPLVEADKPNASFKQYTPPHEVARSLVEDIITASLATGDGAIPGLFHVPGMHDFAAIKKNFPNEYKRSYDQNINWYRNLAAMADTDWNKYHNLLAISDLQRIAGRALNLNKEWIDFKQQEQDRCPMCQSFVNRDAVFCPSCTYILKPEIIEANKDRFLNYRGGMTSMVSSTSGVKNG